MSFLLLMLTTWFIDIQIVTSVIGMSVFYYSIMEGIFMIWDKLRYGIPIFWIPD